MVTVITGKVITRAVIISALNKGYSIFKGYPGGGT